MNYLKCILILILIHNTAFAQDNSINEISGVTEAITEMERVYEETLNTKLGIKTCRAVLEQVPKYSKTYFEAMLTLGEWHLTNRDTKAIKNLLLTLKADIEISNSDKDNKTAWIYYLYLNSRYNSEITYNAEKAAIQGVSAFYMAKGKPNVLRRITPQAAISLADLAQYKTAEDITKIYEVSEKLNRKNDVATCRYLLRLGHIYNKTENWEKSKRLLEEALSLITHKAGQYPFLYENCLISLAKSISNGTKNSVKALEVLDRLPKDENRSYKYWAEYSNQTCYENNPDDAIILVQKALNKIVPSLSSDNIMDNPSDSAYYMDYKLGSRLLYSKAMILWSKAWEIANTGDKTEAETLFKKSIETANTGIKMYNRLTDEMTGFGIAELLANEEIHTLMGAKIHAAYGLYKTTESKANFNQLFQYMEQRRSLSILQQTVKSPIPEDLLPKFETYFNDIEQYEIIFSIGIERSFQKLMEAAELTFEYETFFKKLKQQTDKVRLTPDDFKYISADELQQSLDDKTVFIQYSVARHHIYSISITKDSCQAMLVYDGEEMFENKIYPFIDMIRHPLLIQDKKRTTFIENSHYFYNLLIQPFEAVMQGKTRFVISPERELLFLPYETLLKSNADKPFHELDFLVKSFEINYRYSATLHQQIQDRPAIKNYSILAFAPVFENGEGTSKNDRSVKAFTSNKYSSTDKKKFVYLPHSKREIEMIQHLIGDKGESTILIANEATKNNLQQKITDNTYQFVHLATHSMVNFDDPRVSAIACYQVNNSENLYLSSEIIKENIQADLVVLSSCESGLGRIIEGEGIIGLNRSFITAGARNVLFSLWKIDDKGCTELMISFYENYLKTENYTTALRQAKLKMLEDEIMANPRYWAAFVLIGE